MSTDSQIPPRLDEALKLYITAKEAEGCTPRTLDLYRWVLNAFCRWLAEEGVTDLDQLTPHIMRRYLVKLSQADFKASYRHLHARTIKTFLRFLYAEGLLPTDITARVTMPRLDKLIPPAFSNEDVQKLIAACSDLRDQAIVLTLLDTGVRAQELCTLKIADVDLNTGTVQVHQGKGRKDRVVYMGAMTRRAVRKYLMARADVQTHDPLFPSQRTAAALTPNSLLLLCHRLGERAKVANCHPHTFRRTFALTCLRKGMSIYALQRLMGHSDLTTLGKYLALVDQDLRTAHSEHGAVAALFDKEKT